MSHRPRRPQRSSLTWTKSSATGSRTVQGTARERRLASRAERDAALLAVAANHKCLAETNKPRGRAPTTKRHDNDFAQIPFRGPMHPVGRNDRGYRDALLLPPARRR